MRAAWRCGSVAPIRADAALQGCAAFRIALLAPLLGAAPVKALPIWNGTGSWNLSPSSGESTAKPTFVAKASSQAGRLPPGLEGGLYETGTFGEAVNWMRVQAVGRISHR
jgi:hypothetical protein